MVRMAPSRTPTALLRAWGRGDQGAFDELVPLVYAELRRIARQHLGHEGTALTLQPTALVNEAYLRLIDVNRIEWQNRHHFFAVAASVMRRLLVDAARARRAQKRGGGAQMASLDDELVVSNEPVRGLVELDDALRALAAVDPRKAQVVELRYFAGMTVDETATLLQVSPNTVMRDWRLAKVWLLRELSRP